MTPAELAEQQRLEALIRNQGIAARGPETEVDRPQDTISGPLRPVPLEQRVGTGATDPGHLGVHPTETYTRRPVAAVSSASGRPPNLNLQPVDARGMLGPETLQDFWDRRQAPIKLETKVRSHMAEMPRQLQEFYGPAFALGQPNAENLVNQIMGEQGLSRAAAEAVYQGQYADIMEGLSQPVVETAEGGGAYYRSPHTAEAFTQARRHVKALKAQAPELYRQTPFWSLAGRLIGSDFYDMPPLRATTSGIHMDPASPTYKRYRRGGSGRWSKAWPGQETSEGLKDVSRHEGAHVVHTWGGKYRAPEELPGHPSSDLDSSQNEWTYAPLKRVFPFLGGEQHYQRSAEIQANAVYSIAYMGRYFTAGDIDTMRGAFGWERTPYQASADLVEAVNDPQSQKFSSQEIADALNQTASRGKKQ